MVAQVGLVYIYVMLFILVIGLGAVGLRVVDWFSEFVKKPNTPRTVEQNQQDLTKLIVFSGILLLLSLYSLGVVQVMGIGSGSHH